VPTGGAEATAMLVALAVLEPRLARSRLASELRPVSAGGPARSVRATDAADAHAVLDRTELDYSAWSPTLLGETSV
jgi:hypothetical protein